MENLNVGVGGASPNQSCIGPDIGMIMEGYSSLLFLSESLFLEWSSQYRERNLSFTVFGTIWRWMLKVKLGDVTQGFQVIYLVLVS